MACIRKRHEKWMVACRDAAGVRRWKTCGTKQAAEDEYAKLLPATRQASQPAVNPNLTVGECANRWLGLIAAMVRPRTPASYT
jgi:hypothetical protein